MKTRTKVRKLLLWSVILFLATAMVLCRGIPNSLSTWIVFRNTERKNLVGPSSIVDINKDWYYNKMIVGETEHGICLLGQNRSSTSPFEKPTYRFSYVEKTGNITLVSPAYEYTCQQIGEQETQPVYLFIEHPLATSAELTLQIRGEYNHVLNYSTFQDMDLILDETFHATALREKEGFFYYFLQAENIHGSAALAALSQKTSGAFYYEVSNANVTITAIVTLYNVQGSQIAEYTIIL